MDKFETLMQEIAPAIDAHINEWVANYVKSKTADVPALLASAAKPAAVSGSSTGTVSSTGTAGVFGTIAAEVEKVIDPNRVAH
jgi:hypothetical protein